MAYTHYDRLTALDCTFLDLESEDVHMHVASVGIFEPGPLADGAGIDFERVRALVESRLRRVPRFRQKLARIPVTGRRVWVDDEHFNLLFHLRHTSIPAPGDERQLKRLSARILSQKLDRDRPLWELWFVEGLEEGRFAVISKVHHCMIDGISGVELLAAFMDPDDEQREPAPGHRWVPRPPPSGVRMLADEVARRAALPLRSLGLAAQLARRPGETLDQVLKTASGFLGALGASLVPASATPLNVATGPHRRFDWGSFDLGVVREVKEKLGCTLNDVVLACVTGAVRSYLHDHDTSLQDLDFRVFVPVSTRRPSQRGRLGNRVSLLIASLPVDEPDPVERVRRINEETRSLKASGRAEGAEVIEELSDWTSSTLLTSFSRLAAARRSYNLVVTNVPGPPFPVYLCGAKLLQTYPLVPLFTGQALGVATLSYDQRLHWGFNADWEALPDLHEFVLAVEREFETLRKL